MITEQDDKWLQNIRRSLDESVEQLDAATLSRLNQARQHALRARTRPHLLLPVSALGAATAASLALFLWWQQPAPLAEPGLWEDFEIVAGQPDLDFYQNLEFYQWLDGEDAG